MRLTNRQRYTTVLCYHAVSDEWPAPLAVSSSDLRQQVSAFLRRGFVPATFTDAVSCSDQRLTLAVTFDDGYRSVFERALPVLTELGVPATLFVPTEHAGDGTIMSWAGIDRWVGGSWEQELASATWDEIGQLQEAGWEIGSHTRSHPHLTTLTDAELASELGGSRGDCEARMKVPCRSVAYPYGDVDPRVARAARAAGYTAGASLPERLESGRTAPDPMRWPRVAAFRSDSLRRIELKDVLLRRAPRAWALAQAGRRALRTTR